MSSDDSNTIPEPVAAGRRTSAPDLGSSSARYRIDGLIGSGGMGEVSSAYDLEIGRDVAIKQMRGADPADGAVGRFLREARIQARLDHPAIVPVHEVGRDAKGRPFFTMKKLAGTTLRAILEDSDSGTRYPRERLLRAFADVCLAIELAHTRGIVHRDVKPSNIVLGDFGEVYILDWGIAKASGQTADDLEAISGEQLATQAGSIIGTPGYMPPEQINSVHDLDGRADVYALGCVLFEILTGESLHPRGIAGIDSAMHAIDARPSQRTREVPPELDQICVDATRPDRETRIATARMLAERVLRYLDGDRDLVQRQTLARTHLEAALRAFASPDDEPSRRTAMREAGRALALDPKLDAAAALLGRLMIEPPRSLPAEVEERIASEATAIDRRHLRLSLRLSFAYLVILLVMVVGHAKSVVTIAFAAAVALNFVLLQRGVRRIATSPYVRAARSAIIVAILARAFSPFFIAPAFAGLVTSVVLLRTEYTRARTAVLIAAMMAAAVLVPWVLEATGAIASTMVITRTSFVFTAYSDLAPFWHLLSFVAFTLGLIGASASLAYTIRRSERASKRALYLQTWQLEQLVTN